ncbi:hypothetical protein Tco_1292915 [Tanacetum coccineum]
MKQSSKPFLRSTLVWAIEFFSDASLRTSLLYVVAQGYKVKEANKAILEAILKKHDGFKQLASSRMLL